MRISTEVDAETAAMIEVATGASGQTAEEFVAEAVRNAAQEAAENVELMRLAEPGLRDLEEGRWLTHEQMMASIRARPTRRRD